MTIEWGPEHSRAACSEGWDIFVCGGDHAPYEIEALQEDWEDSDGTVYVSPFRDENGHPDDQAAWRHVVCQAMNNSALHTRALAFLNLNSPEELELVLTQGTPEEKIFSELREMIKETS